MSLINKISSDEFLKKHFKVVNEEIAVEQYERFGLKQENVTNYYLSVYTLLNTCKSITQNERLFLQNLLMKKIKAMRSIESSTPHIINYQTGSILIDHRDYPDTYVNLCHDEDYIQTSIRINNEFIYNHGPIKNERLLVRMPVRLNDNTYTSMTFIIDTGCPTPIILSTEASSILQTYNRLREDDAGSRFLTIGGMNFIYGHHVEKPMINIIGLPFLRRFQSNIQIRENIRVDSGVTIRDYSFTIVNFPEIF